MSQTEKLQLIQLVWALQEFSARNCESIPLHGISCASGERLAALAFRLRRTLAPSALALRPRFSLRHRRSYSGQLPRIESLTKTKSTLVLLRGEGGYHPLTVCLRPHKNAKESDPGHVGHLFYILCGHFDEKTGGTP